MNDSDLSLETRVAFLVPLNKLTADRQNRLLQQSDVLALRKRDKLFDQGDRDDFTFYLLDGEIEMFADDSLIKRVVGGEGASFQPLAQLQPRQMSAIAKTRAQVLRVRRSLLEQLLSIDDPEPAAPAGSGVEATEIDTVPASDWLLAVLQSDLFSRIPAAHIQALLDALESVEFRAGTAVIHQGQPGDYFYIIQRGTCEVTRTGANGRDIRLATLYPGDTFGEEALVSGTTRNATVRLVTDGELARLTQDGFTRLILAPLLDAVTRAEAEARIAAGARWLDVRFEDEHAHNGLADSLNIPLSMLRTRLGELPAKTPYVVYCDTGGRSSAAAFLLAERGYDVCYVAGGAVRDELPAAAAATPPAAVHASSDAVLEASALASALEAELERARLTIDRAQQMMADASAMKADAERIVARQLAEERSRIGSETATLAQKLAEAERLRAALAAQEQAARQAALEQQRALEEHVQSLEADARERLLEEQRRLAALYQTQTETLESLQADRESELRTQLEQELAAERGRLTQQFLQTTAALEQAREERRLALAARDAATVEAQALIAEFKAQQQQLLGEQQAAFDRERARLQAEAARNDALREDATRARYEAEAARDAACRALDEARAAQAAAQSEPRAGLDTFEHRVAIADRELQQALAIETAAQTAARDTQDVLSRTYDNNTEISLLLQQELDDWVAEQTRLQESTLQQETRSKQQAMLDRIRNQTSATKQARERQTQTLLDEIAQQLRGD